MTSPTDSIASGRPGTRTLTVCEADYVLDRTTQIDLTLDEVVDSYLDDYQTGLDVTGDPDRYRADEPDLAVWEGSRLLAVIKQVPGDDPEVIRLAERGEWETPDRSPRGEFRSFTVITADPNIDPDETDRFSGWGMTIDHVLDWENRIARIAFACAAPFGGDPLTPDSPEAIRFALDWPELIVLEGNRVAGLMRMVTPGELTLIPIDSA